MDEELVLSLMAKCFEYSNRSTCNRRRIAAALAFEDGTVYLAANGSPTDPCNEKGIDYCTRTYDSFAELSEYPSCPSPCAEGSVILSAKADGKEGGTLLTTDFPCERCTSILIDSGIVSELYFGVYKNYGDQRGREFVYELWLSREGIPVYEVGLEKIFRHPDVTNNVGVFRHAVRTPATVYLRQMEENGIKVCAERGKILWTAESSILDRLRILPA
jgi:deoxycytidylate deaminase